MWSAGRGLRPRIQRAAAGRGFGPRVSAAAGVAGAAVRAGAGAGADAAPEAMMGKEEEIARIARRLDKMVTRKSAVRGVGHQNPGTPALPTPG